MLSVDVEYKSALLEPAKCTPSKVLIATQISQHVKWSELYSFCGRFTFKKPFHGLVLSNVQIRLGMLSADPDRESQLSLVKMQKETRARTGVKGKKCD